ncbi:MAG: restriction endonuclease [Alphaproteobacteria bacterium]|nr:MAG: restriction endonuclease [Alphaproteobacteria bacterium]
MNEITLHPNVYSTGASKGLIHLLERVWVNEHKVGDGTMYVVSGFANYNGGVRFYETFKAHKEKGGNIVAVFAGSTSARLASKQVVRELLECGADVHLVNRKRLLHAKCYGATSGDGQSLVVTSGNFTGPGMALNVEMSVLLEPKSVAEMGFSWQEMIDGVLAQTWDIYRPELTDLKAPAWQLLYDEQASDIGLDDSDKSTMILRLSHSDTARINAEPGSPAGRGTQYFWLSKDCFGFFPPLTLRNKKGHKATYSCLVNMLYVDINKQVSDCRVTFEAENNLDFRLGTGPLRYTGIAVEGDIAAISRIGDHDYELRVFVAGTDIGKDLAQYAVNLIGHQGKRFGYMPNLEFEKVAGVALKKGLALKQ